MTEINTTGTEQFVPGQTLDLQDQGEGFRQAVVHGLSNPQKTIPARFLYDERGSALFDQICELDEYYITRTETQLLKDNDAHIHDTLGENVLLIELGSGSSTKTHILLEALGSNTSAYVPLDVSKEHMEQAARRVRDAFPDLDVTPVAGSFLEDLPRVGRELDTPGTRVAFFPGSTLGNLEPDTAQQLLRDCAEMVGPGGGILLGVDLAKDPGIILPAYNDSKGVTAAFELNLLARANRELDADFDIDSFEYQGRFVEEMERVELHVVAKKDMTVTIDGQHFHFDKGESIHIESSHKWPLDKIQRMLENAGFTADSTVWTDPEGWFALIYARTG